MLQRSDEWRQARCGKVTASRVADVLSKIRTGEAAARRDYKFQLVSEIISGRPQDDGYINEAMQYGIDHEDEARSAYEAQEGILVEQIAIVQHPRIERAAASPDGLILDNGILELKAPKLATHLNYLLDGVMPAKYQPQCLWQLACCEREFCDFVSFRPDLPPELQLFKVRFNRDDKRIAEMEIEVTAFLAEVDELLDRLRKRL